MGKKFTVVNFRGMPKEVFYEKVLDYDHRTLPLIYLREAIEEAGFAFNYTDDGRNMEDSAVVLCLTQRYAPFFFTRLAKIAKKRCFLCMLEPPINPVFRPTYEPWIKDYFGTFFTMFDDQVDGHQYLKMYHWVSREYKVEPVDFAQKKTCVMIQTNWHIDHPQELYSERRKLVYAVPKQMSFDLYGEGWKNEPAWPLFGRGFLHGNKLDKIRHYKFMIAFENMKNQKGYITERMFDAFYGRCVPVYWGADNIEELVPKSCFVDRRDFSSYSALIDYMQNIDRKTHEAYLAAGAAYLESPLAKRLFSPRSFGNDIVAKIQKRLQDLHL